MTRCACLHEQEQHAAAGGPCDAELPPFDEEELPAWRCPCRRFHASTTATRLLQSVQSCTVHAAPRAVELRLRGPITPGDARVPAGDRLWRLGRTAP